MGGRLAGSVVGAPTAVARQRGWGAGFRWFWPWIAGARGERAKHEREKGRASEGEAGDEVVRVGER